MAGSGHPVSADDVGQVDQAALTELKPARKKLKKGKKKRNAESAGLAQADDGSGQPPRAPPLAGNKDEAQHIRQRLGIRAEDAKSSQTRVGFQFAFSVSEACPDMHASDSDHGAAPSPGKVESDATTAPDVRTNISGDVDSKIQAPDPLPGPPVSDAKPPLLLQPDESGYIPRRVYIGGMPFWYTEEEIRQCWSECGEIGDLTMLTFPDSGNFRGIVFITFVAQEGYDAALQFDGDQLDGKTLVVKPCKAPTPSSRAPARDGNTDQSRSHGGNQTRSNTGERQQRGMVHDKRDGDRTAAQKRGRMDDNASGGRAHNAQEGTPHDDPSTKKQRKSHDAPPEKVKGYNVLFVGNIPWELSRSAVTELFEDFKPKFVRMFDKAGTRQHKGFAHIHFADEEAVDKAMSMDGASIMGRTLKVMYAQPSRTKKSKATTDAKVKDLIEDGA